MGVLPIDPGMTAGDHLLLHVGSVGVQLADSAAIAIAGDTAHREALPSRNCRRWSLAAVAAQAVLSRETVISAAVSLRIVVALVPTDDP